MRMVCQGSYPRGPIGGGYGPTPAGTSRGPGIFAADFGAGARRGDSPNFSVLLLSVRTFSSLLLPVACVSQATAAVTPRFLLRLRLRLRIILRLRILLRILRKSYASEPLLRLRIVTHPLRLLRKTPCVSLLRFSPRFSCVNISGYLALEVSLTRLLRVSILW